jgi:hypothetical protein
MAVTVEMGKNPPKLANFWVLQVGLVWVRRTNPLSREGWRCGQCVFGGGGERMNRKG